MLKSYPAQLDGVTLRWLDRAPARAPVKPVMVVVDESDGDAVREQRTQRDAW